MGFWGAPFGWPLSALDRQYLSKKRVYRLTGKVCQQPCEYRWSATVCKKSMELLVAKSSAWGKSARKQLPNETQPPISTNTDTD